MSGLCIAVLLLLALIALDMPAEHGPRYEAYGVVTRVVDEDTVEVGEPVFFDEEITRRVNASRLRTGFADVNVPEPGTLEGERSMGSALMLVYIS